MKGEDMSNHFLMLGFQKYCLMRTCGRFQDNIYSTICILQYKRYLINISQQCLFCFSIYTYGIKDWKSPMQVFHSVKSFWSGLGFPAKVIFCRAWLLSQAFPGSRGRGGGWVGYVRGFSMKKLVALCSPTHWGGKSGQPMNSGRRGNDTIGILSHNREKGETRQSSTLLLLHE